ncbi:MAG: leucyl aminopeptidase [Candidatus Liptonbacteria bacterium]|nr:leucyl aminopeptidase [Candidatus Liptonbacteria bacterium]
MDEFGGQTIIFQMKLELIKKLPTEGAIVFVIKEGVSLKTHPFLKFLGEEDKKYIETVTNASGASGISNKFLILPSGRKTLIISVPAKDKFTGRKAILSARRVIVAARSEKLAQIVVLLEDFQARTSPQETATMLGTQLEIANFEFVAYKTAPKEGWNFVEEVGVFSKYSLESLRKALEAGKVVGEEVNAARVLSNTPGGDMTPAGLAEAALQAGKKSGFKVTILDEKEITKLGMGGVLGVSKGSVEKPRFIVIEYLRGKKSEKPVVIVGKGVTFDTGGLNLKPTQAIYEMHMDMSGGAATIHILGALARLNVKKNVIGLVPAVENMPSGSSFRPGDLLKSMSGKTIEVTNTDAEGRVILADALEYAKRYNPRLVVDIATLTGAALVALGQRASAIFSTSAPVERSLRAIGEETGDFVWPLPLWEEYEEDIKGMFGDFANSGKSRWGGAIEGAVFLRQFIRDKEGNDAYPWVHLDIAPRMTSVDGEFLAKGAAAPSVALLTQFLREY